MGGHVSSILVSIISGLAFGIIIITVSFSKGCTRIKAGARIRKQNTEALLVLDNDGPNSTIKANSTPFHDHKLKGREGSL